MNLHVPSGPTGYRVELLPRVEGTWGGKLVLSLKKTALGKVVTLTLVWQPLRGKTAATPPLERSSGRPLLSSPVKVGVISRQGVTLDLAVSPPEHLLRKVQTSYRAQ